MALQTSNLITKLDLLDEALDLLEEAEWMPDQDWLKHYEGEGCPWCHFGKPETHRQTRAPHDPQCKWLQLMRKAGRR